MAFDNIGFFTLSPSGNPGGGDVQQHGVTFNGEDRGAVYVGVHMEFNPGTILVDSQITLKDPNGRFSYFANFHNLTKAPVSFTLTGGGFV
jgi:hypothetical protein